MPSPPPASPAQRLRQLLSQDTCHALPCCWDALSARMVAAAGFPLTFMSGFAVSAARLGAPDLGLISYGEMVDVGRTICGAVSIPVLGDGDTGYGNAMNVRRTVEGYARAGFAAVMIEDQVAPKRCGHTRGKAVVGRDEAFVRIRAAIDARDALQGAGGDILVLARTDARATDGFDEAIFRAAAFADLGADILFVEAPESEMEMARITREVPGVHMANLLEGGKTPIVPREKLHTLGFRLAAYPLTLLAASMQAISETLVELKSGHLTTDDLLGGAGGVAREGRPRKMPFDELRRHLDFDDYYAMEAQYARAESTARDPD